MDQWFKWVENFSMLKWPYNMHILCDPLVINQRVTAVWRKKAKNKIKWGGSSVVSDKLEEWRKQKLVEIKD